MVKVIAGKSFYFGIKNDEKLYKDVVSKLKDLDITYKRTFYEIKEYNACKIYFHCYNVDETTFDVFMKFLNELPCMITVHLDFMTPYI